MNTLGADELATQRAKASMTMVLTNFFMTIPVAAQVGLNVWSCITFNVYASAFLCTGTFFLQTSPTLSTPQREASSIYWLFQDKTFQQSI